jgi:uncharacterized membrane protein
VTAAVATSELWVDGVVITAAVTPVIVALVSEGLSDIVDALVPRRLAALAGAEGRSSPAPEAGRVGRRRFPLLGALATGLLGFALAVVVLTVPESLMGHSLVGDHDTTFGDLPTVDQLRAWIEDLRLWVEELVVRAEGA